MLKALYRMIVSLVFYYNIFRNDIESIGVEVNPYEICVNN